MTPTLPDQARVPVVPITDPGKGLAEAAARIARVAAWKAPKLPAARATLRQARKEAWEASR